MTALFGVQHENDEFKDESAKDQKQKDKERLKEYESAIEFRKEY